MKLPPHFAVVTPYLVVERAPDFMDVLSRGLGGTETLRHRDVDRIVHGEVRFGNATVMVCEASPDFPAQAASMHLYVEDADAALAQAVAAGAVEAMPGSDKPCGDRQGGVRDRQRNIWWLSQRLADGPYG